MPRSRPLAILVVALLPAVAWSSPRARFGDGVDARARALFEKAEARFGQQQFSEAITLYREAYELKSLPGFLFNIAQCYRLSGDFDQAVVYFERYLGRYPDSPHREQIERLLTQMEPRARVQRARREAQEHAAAGVSSGPATVSATPSEGPSRLTQVVLLSSGVVLTASFVAAGLVTGALASDKADAYGVEQEQGRRKSLKESGQMLRAVSIASFATAGLVAAGTGLYFLLASEPARRDPKVSAVPLPRGAALLVRGRF